jgi:hypothetical protein
MALTKVSFDNAMTNIAQNPFVVAGTALANECSDEDLAKGCLGPNQQFIKLGKRAIAKERRKVIALQSAIAGMTCAYENDKDESIKCIEHLASLIEDTDAKSKVCAEMPTLVMTVNADDKDGKGGMNKFIEAYTKASSRSRIHAILSRVERICPPKATADTPKPAEPSDATPRKSSRKRGPNDP